MPAPASSASLSAVDGIADLVAQADRGDRASADRLFTVLYGELHRMAKRELSKRGYGITRRKRDGIIIHSSSDVKPGDAIVTRLAEGEVVSTVEHSIPDPGVPGFESRVGTPFGYTV